MFDFLLQGLAIGLSAGISPGPLLILFLSKALQDGWRKTLPAAFAPLLSDGPIILLTVFILSALPEGYLDFLRVAGGLFLLYLGWKTVRDSEAEPDAPRSQKQASSFSTLRSAALINLLNPNPYIFWGTILGPTLVIGWRRSPQVGLAFMAGFYGALIGVFMTWIIITGAIGAVNQGIRRIFTVISGLGMAGFGVFQLLTSLMCCR